MMDDKKPSLAILIGKKLGGKPPEDKPMEEGDDKGSAALSAMDDFISAVHAKDSQAALDCLHDVLDLIHEPEPDGDE